MPAALKITLTTKEDKTLQELEVADVVLRRTKKRAILRLNAEGWKVKAIANYLEWAESTLSDKNFSVAIPRPICINKAIFVDLLLCSAA